MRNPEANRASSRDFHKSQIAPFVSLQRKQIDDRPARQHRDRNNSWPAHHGRGQDRGRELDNSISIFQHTCSTGLIKSGAWPGETTLYEIRSDARVGHHLSCSIGLIFMDARRPPRYLPIQSDVMIQHSEQFHWNRKRMD